MSKCADLDFEVRWLPFQLNPEAPQQPTSKTEAYMHKFKKSKAEVQQMGAWMGDNFKAVGLPYNFTDAGLVSNTFEAHRLLTWAYHIGGPAGQDKVAESLFHAYFADELAPNDPHALQKAAEAAGLDGQAFLEDSAKGDAQTREEFKVGRKLGVRGVPHFVICKEGASSNVQISGAQPPKSFVEAFRQVVAEQGAGGQGGCAAC